MQNVKDAAHAIAEKVKGVTSGASFEANKEAATTNNYSTGNHTDRTVDIVTDKNIMPFLEEKNNEAKKEATEERGVIGHIGDTLSNAYHYVAEKVHEATSVVSFENNKEKVKDSDNTVGERVTAACSAVGDKTEEKVHQAQAEAHKEAM
ncbi:unnamed protein product [Rotaria sp. Silwood2]|nr:unnamed protein product [Rotaria sp. Silwood2]CAF2576608.1 unnamed protein product [Rotaria sp. Silwood2]CAF2832419.1 unnamed protein product [Rotaria sp. Silwood2]CAF2976609.1 unnamed protein product [Rotaria sp. Silwood2]CAF4003960.1 unnamed protein product [Rotaria sp. Silwood2]